MLEGKLYFILKSDEVIKYLRGNRTEVSSLPASLSLLALKTTHGAHGTNSTQDNKLRLSHVRYYFVLPVQLGMYGRTYKKRAPFVSNLISAHILNFWNGSCCHRRLFRERKWIAFYSTQYKTHGAARLIFNTDMPSSFLVIFNGISHATYTPCRCCFFRFSCIDFISTSMPKKTPRDPVSTERPWRRHCFLYLFFSSWKLLTLPRCAVSTVQNAPKPAKSAYLLYQNAMRDTFKAQNPGMTFGQLSKFTSAMVRAAC